MRFATRASFFGMLVLVGATVGCGPQENNGSELGSESQAIVFGKASPSIVSLTAKQQLAIGGVLVPDHGGWVNKCTATLVAPTLAITAAHCVEGLTAEEIAFAIGADLANPKDWQIVSAVHVHPDYDVDSAEHDFAVLELASPFGDVEPLTANCDALPSSKLVGAKVQLAGYGETEDDPDNARQWWAPTKVIALGAFEFIVDGGGVGACYGDSGGPALSTLVGGFARVLGTLSWGDAECGQIDHFTRVDDNCAFLRSFEAAAATQSAATGSLIEGVVFSAAQAVATLSLVNTASLSELDFEVGLDSRAAKGIVAQRPFSTLEQLAAVSYVGPSALERLRDYSASP